MTPSGTAESRQVFTAYKVRWSEGIPEVWAYTAFGPHPAERGHKFVGVAKHPEEYLTHVGRRDD